VGALTVAVVTKPFLFEGRVRAKQAERGIEALHQVVDTLITIPNNRLLALAGKTLGLREAFTLADEVLLNAVRGISDLITTHGLINLDFADVRTIMNEMGMALMGTGIGVGESRAVDAARAAISSPLLEDLSIEGARGVLINVTGGPDMTLFEVNEASSLVQDAAHEDANIIFGAVVDDALPEGEIRVTVIATGLEDERPRRRVEREGRGEARGGARPLRPEPAAPERALPAASTRAHSDPERPAPRKGGDWVSPFEDELDVPTFIRRNEGREAGRERDVPSFVRHGEGEEGEEDREIPAFLRRQAD
jgi:cell division protein FtsZ